MTEARNIRPTRNQRLIQNLVSIAYVFALAASCAKKVTPEEQIKSMFQQSLKSVNNKDLGSFMENISDQFIGPYTMNKQDAKRYIFAQLYRKQWHRVFLYDAKIDIHSSNEASATIQIALARGSKIETLQDLTKKADYDAFQLKLNLEKQDSRWLVTHAKHQTLNGLDN